MYHALFVKAKDVMCVNIQDGEIMGCGMVINVQKTATLIQKYSGFALEWELNALRNIYEVNDLGIIL